MTQAEILPVLHKVVRAVLDDDDIDLTQETLIRDIPEWDSLNNMHIVVKLEKALGFDFQQSDFEGLTTVGELVNLIIRRKNGT